MKTESLSFQKRVRAMGTALAVVSFLGLLFWLSIALVHVINPTWILGFEDKEDLTYFARLAGEDTPDPKAANDKELRNHFVTHFAQAKQDLPDGVSKEIYANTMVYYTKLHAGEVVQGFMLPDSSIDVDPNTGELLHPDGQLDPGTAGLPDPNFGWDFTHLSAGMTADTTVRELILKDRAYFEAHSGTYQLLAIVTAVFFLVVSIVILRMALSWRQGDPFGPGTTRGLRWLGILFLAQFLASFVFVLIVPESGFVVDLTIYSSMFDDLAANFGTGASLSCGIVFLTLSWVLEYGRKMKEEQALTI